MMNARERVIIIVIIIIIIVIISIELGRTEGGGCKAVTRRFDDAVKDDTCAGKSCAEMTYDETKCSLSSIIIIMRWSNSSSTPNHTHTSVVRSHFAQICHWVIGMLLVVVVRLRLPDRLSSV